MSIKIEHQRDAAKKLVSGMPIDQWLECFLHRIEEIRLYRVQALAKHVAHVLWCHDAHGNLSVLV